MVLAVFYESIFAHHSYLVVSIITILMIVDELIFWGSCSSEIKSHSSNDDQNLKRVVGKNVFTFANRFS